MSNSIPIFGDNKMELQTQFRNAAHVKGLTKKFDGEPEFIFYLNQGDLRTVKDPEVVKSLVELANEVYDNGGMNGSGEGRVMLSLITKKSDLDQKTVLWDNASSILDEYDSMGNEYITLDCFLKNCEQ